MAVLLFNFFRPPVAAALTFLGASMFLPSAMAVDYPALPDLSKEEFASIGCLLGMLIFAWPQVRRARLGRGPEVLVLGLMAGVVGSLLTNRDPLVFGPLVVPGTEGTELPAAWTEVILRWGVPFVAGRALFTRPRDVRALFAILVAAALVYSLLILVELRMSPQLHRWIYGFHQHQFSQTIRDSGYRPMVFMRHGLHLSLFVALCLMAACTLVRMRLPFQGLPTAPFAGWLAVVLVLCKSLGSLIYGLVTAPLILFTSPRLQSLAACGLAALVLAYPLLRTLDVLPVDTVIELAEEQAGERRASSLAGRLTNERAVLERARERIVFGWFGSGRSMLREPDSGTPLTTFDGYWIIALGAGGLVRFLCVFGMLLWPVFRAARLLPYVHERRNRAMLGGLSLMVAISTFDLLPNSTVEGYMTLFSGALAGVLPGILAEERRARRARRRRRQAAAAASAPGPLGAPQRATGAPQRATGAPQRATGAP